MPTTGTDTDTGTTGSGGHPDPDETRARLDADTQKAWPSLRGEEETAELARRIRDAQTATPGLTLEVRPEEVHALLGALWQVVGAAPCTHDWVGCEQVPHGCERRGRVERVLARLARAHDVTLPGVDPDAA